MRHGFSPAYPEDLAVKEPVFQSKTEARERVAAEGVELVPGAARVDVGGVARAAAARERRRRLAVGHRGDARLAAWAGNRNIQRAVRP